MLKNTSLHPLCLFANDLRDICKPLGLLNINYFSHVRINENNEFSALTNNPKFGEHYLQKKYYNADIHLAQSTNLGKYILWDALECHDQSSQLNEDAAAFGVDHTFTIVDDQHGEKNYYHFSSNLLGKSINQVYLRNIDLLERFILHFTDKVSQANHLSTAYNILFAIDNPSGFSYTSAPTDEKLIAMRDQFIQSTPLTHSLPTHVTKLLSKREIDCLEHYINGLSANKIANLLNLSKRTIENYIHNIKQKLNASTKMDLLYKVKRNDKN